MKRLGKDIGSLTIHHNVDQFNFTVDNMLADQVIVHLNVLGPGVEDGVPR